MSLVFNKNVPVDELTDRARFIFKVEKLSDLEKVSVTGENGRVVELEYQAVKIIEIMKSTEDATVEDGMSVKSPPRSGLHSLGDKPPVVGQVISIADRSRLEEKPPQGKSYHEFHLENEADPKAKTALLFTKEYQKNLSVFWGLIGRGLVDSGQEKALKKALGLRAYFDAIRNNQLEVLNSAIAKYPEAISNVDLVWGTPLQFAARYGKPEEIDLLVKSGASLSTPNSKGNGVIHDLVASQFAENLPHIIRLGDDINRKNKDGQTPLHLAVQGHAPMRIIRLLIQAGADPAITDANGRSALDLAKALADPEVLKALNTTVAPKK